MSSFLIVGDQTAVIVKARMGINMCMLGAENEERREALAKEKKIMKTDNQPSLFSFIHHYYTSIFNFLI